MGNKERLASIEAVVDEAQKTADSLPDAVDLSGIPTVASQVLETAKYMGTDGELHDGDIPVISSTTKYEISGNGTFHISDFDIGYFDGEQKLVVNVPNSGMSLPSLTAPGTSVDLLTGKELIGADGSIVDGAMPNNGSINRTYTTNGSRTFSTGYYSGGTITVNVPSSTVEVNNPYGNASTNDVRSGVTFMSGGVERTGTMSDASVSIVVDEQTGKITAFNAVAGYLSGGTKDTEYLTTQAAQTITPGTSDKTIGSGTYLTGTQTIAGDANLVSSNIAEGVSIFGVTGSYAGVPGVKLTVTRTGTSGTLTASVGSDVNFIVITRDISSGVPTGGYQVIHLVQYFDDSGNRTGVLVATDGAGDTVTMALGSNVNTTHLQVYISGGTLTVRDNNKYGYIFNGTFTVYGAKI